MTPWGMLAAMRSDGGDGGSRRARGIKRAPLSPGPLRDLKDAVYHLYARAGRPTLDEIAAEVSDLADDLDLPALPRRDTINRIIGDARLPSRQHDVVAVAVVLAHAAGEDAATVAESVRVLWARAAGRDPQSEEQDGPGRRIGDCDPVELEVHPAIRINSRQPLPYLPPYVRRDHDEEVTKIVNEAVRGKSRLAILVGGSSTGKTRACWEALQRLPERWRVWHPFDPTRPEAADRELTRVSPYTVVWFNEAQHYLLTADPALGERIAAGLRTLLLDPARSPVLVLGTIWPQYWDTLTGPSPSYDLDLHAQARELLLGTDITVSESWSAAELRALPRAGQADPRLRDAIRHADAGRITQYLAGVPDLVQRYRNAPPAARAVLTAAIDARRLGHPLPLPHDLLVRAAPDYLADVEWDQASDDWFDQALAYTAKPCHGTAGPLSRIRPRPSDSGAAAPVRYRLADYLQQRGSTERASALPPPGFWAAVAATVDDAATLRAIGDSAASRGRYGRAAPLYRLAAERGDLGALWSLAALRERAGDLAGTETLRRRAAGLGTAPVAGPPQRVDDFWSIKEAELRSGEHAAEFFDAGEPAEIAARWAADHGDPTALRAVAELRERAGDVQGAIDLHRQAADRDDQQSLDSLVLLLEQTGDAAGALDAALRAADHGTMTALWTLVKIRERSGEPAAAEAVATLAADRGDLAQLGSLAAMRERVGDLASAERLYRQAAERGEVYALWSLAGVRELLGDTDEAERLYQQAVDCGTPSGLASLAGLREKMGDTTAAVRLYQRAAEQGSVAALLSLAAIRERGSDLNGAEELYRQAADQGEASALWSLAGLRHQIGDLAGAADLYQQAADHGITAALLSLAELAEDAGDTARAQKLALLAANRGENTALPVLIRLRRRAGDLIGATRIHRFGLDDDGRPATQLE